MSIALSMNMYNRWYLHRSPPSKNINVILNGLYNIFGRTSRPERKSIVHEEDHLRVVLLLFSETYHSFGLVLLMCEAGAPPANEGRVEGTLPDETAPRNRRQRDPASISTTTAAVGIGAPDRQAIDAAPPIAYLTTSVRHGESHRRPQPLDLLPETPEYLMTLDVPAHMLHPQATASRNDSARRPRPAATSKLPAQSTVTWSPTVAPILIPPGKDGGRSYLVAATTCGRLCIWNAVSMLRHALSPRRHSATRVDEETLSRSTSALTSSSLSKAGDVDPISHNHLVQNPTLAPDCVLDLLRDVSLVNRKELNAPEILNMNRSPVVAVAVVPKSSLAAPSSQHGDEAANTTVKDEVGPLTDVNYLVAVTDLGDVSIIEVSPQDESEEFENVSARVVHQFNTGRCAVSCVAVTEDDAEGLNSIVIGYESSCLEIWRIRLDAKEKEELVFRGVFEDGNPIRSIAQLQTLNETADESRAESVEEMPSLNNADANDDSSKQSRGRRNTGTELPRVYVMLTMELNVRHPRSSDAVEVLDLFSMVTAWRNAKQTGEISDQKATIFDDETTVLPLEPHTVLPAAGKELLDSSACLRSNNHRRSTSSTSVPWIPSAGTNHVFQLDQNRNRNGSGTLDMRASCAVALADGTLGIIHAQTFEDGDVSWGIERDEDQLFLSYPCVGMGQIQMREQKDGKDALQDYVVFCLRGATTYLLPLTSVPIEASVGITDAELDPSPRPCPTRVIFFPNDIDADPSAIHRVQGFTAGNLSWGQGLPTEGTTPSFQIPVMVYAWPGGLIDIYSCQLQKLTPVPTSVLKSLVENGSAKILYDILSSSVKFPEDLRHRGPQWEAAFQEIQAEEDDDIHLVPETLSLSGSARSGIQPEIPVPEGTSGSVATRTSGSTGWTISLEDLCSDRFSFFRALLLEFAETTSVDESNAT